MKRYLILAFICTLNITLFGQNQLFYKAGGYSTLSDFHNNTPNYLDTFIVSKRTIGDIKAWGGNDYKVESLTGSTLIWRKFPNLCQ